MAMSVGKPGGDSEVMVDINTTPLIDVMLVLLIMLIITIPVQTHAVKLDMPTNQPVNPPPVTVQPITVGIDFDGTITWNGEAVPDRATLESYITQAAAQDPQPELHIQPDRLAKYSVVAEVLAEAQRNRLVKIGFVGQEQYMQ